MQKWEYKVEVVTGEADSVDYLNSRSNDGWQLIQMQFPQVGATALCFYMREKKESTKPAEWLDKPDSYGLWLFAGKKPMIGYYDGLPFEVSSDGGNLPKMIARDLCARGDYRPITAFVGKWKKMAYEKPPEDQS